MAIMCRRRTRYKYHNSLRKVKLYENHIQANRMAENLDGCNYTDFYAINHEEN